jgi:hypothetical protein
VRRQPPRAEDGDGLRPPGTDLMSFRFGRKKKILGQI